MSARAVPPSYLPVLGQVSHRHSHICMDLTTDPTSLLNWELFYDMMIELDAVFEEYFQIILGNINDYYL